MTPLTWILAAVLGLVLFALGALSTWVFRFAEPGRRVDAVLAVVFTLAAVGVGADTAHLQIQFNRHVHETMACTSETSAALVRVDTARRVVDEAAARYDTAFIIWLAVQEDPKMSGPATAVLKDRLADVKAAREAMIVVYQNNPLKEC